MKIFLIRHGEKEKAMGDPPLSSLGRQQAINTGNHLKKFHINKILASPLLRTRQTAELICKEIGLQFEVDEKLRERINWGDDPDQTFEEFVKEWKKATFDRSYQPHAGNSSENAGKKFEEVIYVQAKRNGINTLALVTHGGVITDFLRNVFTEEQLNHAYDQFSKNIDSLIKECSVTIVNYNNGAFILESLNTVDHLELESL